MGIKGLFSTEGVAIVEKFSTGGVDFDFRQRVCLCGALDVSFFVAKERDAKKPPKGDRGCNL